MVVGLTGGIGSGKTTVARLFQKLGIPVYDSDQRAKDLYIESEELKAKMQNYFGNDIYTDTGINRPKLAQIVFNDKSQLAVLNGFVHPLLQKDFEYWNEKQKAPYVIREAAILIESGAHKVCDKITVVTAPETLRTQRVMERDNASEEQVNQRMANQLTDEERLSYSDFELKNNGTESLIKQVFELDQTLRKFKG